MSQEAETKRSCDELLPNECDETPFICDILCLTCRLCRASSAHAVTYTATLLHPFNYRVTMQTAFSASIKAAMGQIVWKHDPCFPLERNCRQHHRPESSRLQSFLGLRRIEIQAGWRRRQSDHRRLRSRNSLERIGGYCRRSQSGWLHQVGMCSASTAAYKSGLAT